MMLTTHTRFARLITLLLLCGLALTSITASAQDAKPTATDTAPPSAESVARQMQAFYDRTADFQASFKQTYTDLAAGDTKVSVGKVYIKKPGKMRWDYYKEVKGKQTLEKNMVSDGKVFWVYEHEFKQVFKECIETSKLPTSVTFLMGQGNLLESFNATLDAASTTERPVLKLIPKEPTPNYKELHFVIDGKTFQVLKTTIFDPYGNTNEIVFSKVLFDKNLPDKGFQFEVPKGARQLNPQQTCP